MSLETPASVFAQGAGVRFAFDRHRRPVTPVVAAVRRSVRAQWGLHDVNLALGPGDSVALIGATGAGKTTLLRLLAGVLKPDAGQLQVQGRIASLLSVDAGLLTRLTGRENALLLGVLMGRRRRASLAQLDVVKEHSGLGARFDLPVSTYSQGMRARLGFAVAECSEPSVLLLDEVHEALDQEFRARLAKRALEIAARGGVVVAAGHDHPVLERFCHRAIWLRDGTIHSDAGYDQVVADYLQAVERATS